MLIKDKNYFKQLGTELNIHGLNKHFRSHNNSKDSLGLNSSIMSNESKSPISSNNKKFQQIMGNTSFISDLDNLNNDLQNINSVR
jgi:hypothetical protein